MMAEPLWSGGRVVGVLSVSSPEVAVFQASDSLLLRVLAACAVPLLERARHADVAPFDDLTLAATAESVLPRIQSEIERAAPLVASLLRRRCSTLDYVRGHRERLRPRGRRPRACAWRATGCARTCGVFDGFARVGDAEFVLVLSGLGADRAQPLCERIRASIAEPMEPLEGAFLSQTASIAVATWDGIEGAGEIEARAKGLLGEAGAGGAEGVRAGGG